MRNVPAADLAKNFGRFKEIAQREPIAITSHGSESLVLLSAEEYQRLKRLDREVFAVEDLPEDLVAAIAAAEMDPEHAHLDALLDDPR
jgi:prevent-host-death family protein